MVVLKTDQRDTRLAYAREILAGAEQKLGVSASGNFYEGARAVLRRGEVYCAQQSMGQMMSLLVEGMNGQDSSAWAAVLGLKDIGWEKAAQRGVPLSRVVNIPQLHGRAEVVTHYVLQCMDVVVVGDVSFTRSQQNKLAARVRKYGTLLVTWQPWPGISRTLPRSYKGMGMCRDGVSQEGQILRRA